MSDYGPTVEEIAKALHRHEFGTDDWNDEKPVRQERWLARAAVAYAVLRYGSADAIPEDLR